MNDGDVTPTTPGRQLDLIDGHGLAEHANRVTIAELAAAGMAAVGSDNTRRAFDGDWRSWVAFCEMAHREKMSDAPLPLVADHEALLVFVQWLARGPVMPDGQRRRPLAPESLRRRVTGVLAGWTDRGIDHPRGISKNARRWIDWHESQLIEHRQSTGRGKAAPMTVSHLQRMVEACPRDLGGTRDIALLLLDFSVAGRRSELAFLDVDDITEVDNGLDVHVRKSKTGHREVAVLYGQNPATCPVRAWRRWQQSAGIITGAAFRQVDRHGNLGPRMSGEAVGAVITRAAKRAGIEKRLTGHSARRGLATEARAKGAAAEHIADQGGWKRGSAALQGYIDSVDRWTDNVMVGLGL